MKLIDNAVYNLCLKYPFYGIFLSQLRKSYSDEIPTACISKQLDCTEVELKINQQFFSKLTLEKQMFILMHEVLHILYNHFFFGEFYKEKMILNLAADCTINQELRNLNVTYLETAIFPENFPNLNLQLDKGTEYYYNEFLKAKDNKNSKGSSGDENFDKLLDSSKDVHSLWDSFTEVSEIQKATLNKEIQKLVRESFNANDKNIGNIQNIINKHLNISKLQSVVNWKSLLRRFTGSFISEEVRKSKKKINKRFIDSAGNKSIEKCHLLFSVDMSGSIYDKDLSDFYNEIHRAYNSGIKITIHQWDTEVHDVYEYKGEKKYIRKCSGGTNVNPSITLANKNKNQYSAMIILTDGYIPPANFCKLPLLWIISSDGKVNFETQNPKSKKIKIK